MKLLFITQTVDRSDSVLGFTHEWIAEFARHVDCLIVICLYEGEHDLPENVRVLSLGKEHGVSRTKYLRRFYGYIWAERANYDAVFVHMNQAYVILGSVLWKCGALFWKPWRKKIALWYTHATVSMSLRVAERLADVVFTASKESFRVPSAKVAVTGHGIDIVSFKQVVHAANARPHARYRVLTVGRISPTKGQDIMREAIAVLYAKKIPLVLEVVGDTLTEADRRYEERLHQWVKANGLADLIRFWGGSTHANIPQIVSQADICLNISSTNSLDKAALEAMACGVPVITSNEALVALFKAHGLENEGLICAKNDPVDLARKIEAMLSRDGVSLNELGRKLRDIVVVGHSLPKLVGQIVSVMER